MKTDKKPIIGFICVMLSCVLVIGLTLGLLISAGRNTADGSTADSTTETAENSSKEVPEFPSEIEPELQWGYKFYYGSGSGCGTNIIGQIACKSQKNTFNIDNVTLTISYGAMEAKYGPSKEFDVPEFDIYFAEFNPRSENVYPCVYHVKTVKEQFFSEKYAVNMVDDRANRVYYYEFNHSEEITIPKELFTESEGEIPLLITGTNEAKWPPYGNQYLWLCKLYINYKLQGTDKVVLS